ncbi:unnamed protein product [Rodentolepis nana]|uniref:BPTI/Kunitz inhibitor domain-containing protein n=1 Tax=Rodentolepis nana TaxID=102285 RepID=A0A0R3TUM3_RODNA|nr:unnamed protein product [Rodentolepis nana]
MFFLQAEKQKDVELKFAPTYLQSADSNDDDYDDDYDEETDESSSEMEKHDFNIYDPAKATPLEEVIIDTYNNGENAFGQPQREWQEPSYTYNPPVNYAYQYNDTPSSYEYNRTLYNMTYSLDSSRTSDWSESYPQGSSDAERSDNRDYYSHRRPESDYDRTQNYESSYNYSYPQNQNQYPQEPYRRPEHTSYSSSHDDSFRYNYGLPSSQQGGSNENYSQNKRREDEEYSQTTNPSLYYGYSERERTQDIRYNYESNPQEGSSRTQYSDDNNYTYTQDRDQNPDYSHNYSQNLNRDNDDRRTGVNDNESVSETLPEERVDDRSQYYDPQRRQINENDQEVTFDDNRENEADYYESEHSQPVRVIDSITPDPREVDTDPYGGENHRSYDNRLVYQPDSSNDPYTRQTQTGYDSYEKPQDTTTNSYHNRMNQVDEYWREEERRKKMYESQNTYRRDSGSERLDNWAGCSFDSMGRPINCPTGSPGSWSTNEDPISMQAPPQPTPQVYPLPGVNEFPSNPAGDKASAEAEAERSAFERANQVQLSVPHWPTRDMDRLGFYPSHPACRLPPKWGVGPEERSAWFYSPTSGRCLWFSYAGHGGNANRFYSRANCESLCVFDHRDLCQNAKCGYPGSQCMLRGDELCKEYAKSRGKDIETECPPDQPVCRARRAIIPPEYDTTMVPRECKESVDAGGCLVKNPLIRYYYDERSNTCRAFYFHGCGGNNNRFENMQECMNHCAL